MESFSTPHKATVGKVKVTTSVDLITPIIVALRCNNIVPTLQLHH